MTTYTWPANVYPNSSTLSWIDNTARFQSPFSGATRTVNRPGGRWRMSMSFRAKTAEDAQALEAFLWRLDGATHRATIPDFAYRRQGTGAGTPVVDGAGQTGRVLLTSGWTAGQTVLKAGDRVTIAGQMLVVALDVVSSGGSGIYLLDEDGDQILDESSQPILVESGGAQLFLTHSLRSSPADGAAIEVTLPTATYMLADQFEVAAEPGVFKALTVEFEEDISA
jgi:hypothetical protein